MIFPLAFAQVWCLVTKIYINCLLLSIAYLKKKQKTKQKNINFIGLKLFKPTEDLNNNQYVIVREKQILLSVLNLYGFGRLLELIDN